MKPSEVFGKPSPAFNKICKEESKRQYEKNCDAIIEDFWKNKSWLKGKLEGWVLIDGVWKRSKN